VALALGFVAVETLDNHYFYLPSIYAYTYIHILKTELTWFWSRVRVLPLQLEDFQP